MLAQQITLALHHTSTFLQHKRLVHHPFEVLKILGLQSVGQSYSHTKRTRVRSSYSKLGKPDGPVWQIGLSDFIGYTAVRDTVGIGEGVLFPVKWCLTKKENKIRDTSRSCGGG
jgi:hypothetical protein